MNRRPPARCPACPPGATVCRCAIQEAAADRAAETWAREHGAKLEREDRKLGLCGDRFPALDQRRSLTERMLDAAVLRDYRERARLRREEIARTFERLEEEDCRLQRHLEVLDVHFDGEGATGAELAARFGRSSHSWTSEHMQEIRIAARASTRAVGYVGLLCKRPGCPNEIPEERRVWGGRRAEYCSERCRSNHTSAECKARRREKNQIAAQLAAGGVVHGAVVRGGVIAGA